jgi:ankyrin
MVPLLVVTNLTAAGAAASDLRVVEAVKSQDKEAVRLFLKKGADVNTAQADGATALHWAAYWDDRDTADLLIRAGANVNAINDLRVTPLFLASTNGSAAMIDRLLKAGADPNLALSTGETPLMSASRTGNVTAVRLLLMGGANVNATEGSRGQTALMWTVAQGHPQVVQALIEHGADLHARSRVWPQLVNTEGNAKPTGNLWVEQGGFTPLLFAARNGDLDSARLLLAAGANVNDTAPAGTSALVVATHSGHGALAALLLDRGADPNAAGAGYTALHAALLRGDLELVKALLAHGANPNAPVMRGTPVRRLSADWHLNRALIGATPYWLAAKFAEPSMMHILAANGADPLFVKDGLTPLMVAIVGNSYGTQIGAASDRRGRPYYAGTLDEPDPEDEERVTLEAVTVAVELGVDINAADNAGNTALHGAASRRFNTVIQFLAAGGAQLDVKNQRGETPLALAATPRRSVDGVNPPVDDGQSTVDLLRKLGARD